MEQHAAEVRLVDDAEAERFARLRPADAAGPRWVEAGARTARDVVVPAIQAGRYGVTGRDLDRNLRWVFAETIKAMPECTSDEVFLWRLGWEAVVLPAKEAALVAVGIGAGLALAAAAMPAAPVPAHALAMPLAARARRPLRPEDFGALPLNQG